MIAPVSVCHQLSWNAWPMASLPHTTASGFSGSPTLAVNRRVERSYLLGISSPAFMSILIAVGAVYQTETLCFWICSYQALARKPPS